ncbi:2'-5' RNA ligase family protein [Cellulosilyticum sp. I15G10I2]|uniref:2'-5' RNA ligase family protein n=1 Tax=Cellulosilyticum sp. I15G10I2 TaxID=1892843 RepID=UPI00085C9CAC|nr:2'-5' RNA ligase family protein [Cellulosilyticum sp. I15G10I2]
MRYVIVCVVQGEAGEFNNQMRKEVWEKLKAKSSKLPAHFTIKAPFEYDGKITELENTLENFCRYEKAAPFKLDGYGHFGNRVVYMHVDMSMEGQVLHDRLIDVMSKVPYIDFDKKDGKDKTFHVTVASKGIQPIFDQLWQYANSRPCHFSCMFDNITIYKWQDHTWQVHKSYHLN